MRKTVNLIARMGLLLVGVLSVTNIVFVLLGIGRVMPGALSMTGFLVKSGASAQSGSSFYLIYSAVLAGIACIAFALCSLLSVKNRGLMTASIIMYLIDCAGIAALVFANGFRSGYWFEIAGHAVILVLLLAAAFTLPRKAKTSEQ